MIFSKFLIDLLLLVFTKKFFWIYINMIKKKIIILLFLIFLVLSLKKYNLKIHHVENFKNDEKVFLIANNREINKKNLKDFFKNNENYTYVFFNHIGPLWSFTKKELEEFNKYKCKKLLFLRENHHHSYWGKRELNSNKFIMFNNKNSFIIPSKNGNLKKLKNPNNLKILKFKHLIPKKYPKKKEPQTGFIAYHFFKQKYRNIILVGFTRKNGEDPADWFHEKNFELEYYKKNRVPNIIL